MLATFLKMHSLTRNFNEGKLLLNKASQTVSVNSQITLLYFYKNPTSTERLQNNFSGQVWNSKQLLLRHCVPMNSQGYRTCYQLVLQWLYETFQTQAFQQVLLCPFNLLQLEASTTKYSWKHVHEYTKAWHQIFHICSQEA